MLLFIVEMILLLESILDDIGVMSTREWKEKRLLKFIE